MGQEITIAALIAVTNALVEICKQFLAPRDEDGERNKKWMPVCSVVIGVVLGYFFVAGADGSPIALKARMLTGLMIGLSAIGLYDFALQPAAKTAKKLSGVITSMALIVFLLAMMSTMVAGCTIGGPKGVTIGVTHFWVEDPETGRNVLTTGAPFMSRNDKFEIAWDQLNEEGNVFLQNRISRNTEEDASGQVRAMDRMAGLVEKLALASMSANCPVAAGATAGAGSQ